MNYYFDTSSLVKIYHREQGSESVLEIYRSGEAIFISELGRIEFLSTIHRKYRESEIDTDTLDALMQRFEDDIENRYEVLGFSSLIPDEAMNLIRHFARGTSLRALDSLQLAFFTTYCEQDDIFVCSDRRLAGIAGLEGISVLIP
ncbi:MAG: hypothetical protein BWK80_16875 [Desulfobacteraceae bacterium IS3]|nr:MAG: hypothetical protein BWK80_16875 [Desulfobacteraceae bacterium IS3]